MTDKGTAKVITKGTKPTTASQDLPVVYKGDGTKEIGSESTTEGTPQVTTTTYTVNSQTGALNNPQTVTITTKEMKPKVIAKGTKEVVEKQVDFNDVTARDGLRKCTSRC